MKKQNAAGGIIIRKAQGSWEVLMIKDPTNEWTFPKGHIEDSESPEVGARREVTEEVGITDLTLIQPLIPITYNFRADGIIHKTVQYFLFSTTGDKPIVVQKEEGIQDAMWVPLEQAPAFVGYPKTNKRLLKQIQQILKS